MKRIDCSLSFKYCLNNCKKVSIRSPDRLLRSVKIHEVSHKTRKRQFYNLYLACCKQLFASLPITW